MHLSKLSRRSLLTTGLAFGLAAPSVAVARQADDLAQAVVQLFDPSTSDQTRAAFWTNRISEAGQARWPRERFVSDMARAARRSGGVDLEETLEEPGLVRLRLRGRGSGRGRWVRVRRDRDDPDRLFDLSAYPMPAPYRGPGIAGPVSHAELADALDRRFRAAAEGDDFSGAVLVSAPGGQEVYRAAFGMADPSTGQRNRTDTRFHLGSADKSFTALMIARLASEDRIRFDTPLSEVLPDYPNRLFAQACTIDHLLTHASGLGGLFDRPGYDRQASYQAMSDLFGAFATEPAAFAPGTSARYSNEGFVVLGAVVEAVTGDSWYDQLAAQIYGPAGMTRSGHFLRDEVVDGRAIGQTYPGDDVLGFGLRQPNDHAVGYRGNSCGGGYSTVDDMTAYLRALHGGVLIAPAMTAQLITPHPHGLEGYGRGFQLRSAAGGRVVGHSGGGPRSGIDGDSAVVWETGWTYSILGNYDAPFAGEIARDVAQWVALQT